MGVFCVSYFTEQLIKDDKPHLMSEIMDLLLKIFKYRAYRLLIKILTPEIFQSYLLVLELISMKPNKASLIVYLLSNNP